MRGTPWGALLLVALGTAGFFTILWGAFAGLIARASVVGTIGTSLAAAFGYFALVAGPIGRAVARRITE